VHIKDLIVFDGMHAAVFSLGVCCGVNAWLHILICILRRYKHRIRGQLMSYGVQAMGVTLVLLGLSLVNSLVFEDTTPVAQTAIPPWQRDHIQFHNASAKIADDLTHHGLAVRLTKFKRPP